MRSIWRSALTVSGLLGFAFLALGSSKLTSSSSGAASASAQPVATAPPPPVATTVAAAQTGLPPECEQYLAQYDCFLKRKTVTQIGGGSTNVDQITQNLRATYTQVASSPAGRAAIQQTCIQAQTQLARELAQTGCTNPSTAPPVTNAPVAQAPAAKAAPQRAQPGPQAGANAPQGCGPCQTLNGPGTACVPCDFSPMMECQNGQCVMSKEPHCGSCMVFLGAGCGPCEDVGQVCVNGKCADPSSAGSGTSAPTAATTTAPQHD
jgi:hypothetical protein